MDRIILLPRIFRKIGNKSFRDLLKDMGYFELYEDVTESRIYERLKQCPEYCDLWIEWSEYQRVDSGWYLQDEYTGKFIVGYHNMDSKTFSKEFKSKAQAVACFVKKHIEMIRLAEG
jgi:hypothetical protein